jgi:hypothetical protein
VSADADRSHGATQAIGQVKFDRLHAELTGFNFGEIEDVINDGEVLPPSTHRRAANPPGENDSSSILRERGAVLDCNRFLVRKNVMGLSQGRAVTATRSRRRNYPLQLYSSD